MSRLQEGGGQGVGAEGKCQGAGQGAGAEKGLPCLKIVTTIQVHSLLEHMVVHAGHSYGIQKF